MSLSVYAYMQVIRRCFQLYCHLKYCQVVWSDYRRGVGLDLGLIDHFNTHLVSAFNYNVIKCHTLQFTKAHAKSFPGRSVFTSSCLVMIPNNGWFRAQVLSERRLPSNCPFLKVKVVTTDGQSASLSWCQAPVWDLGPDFYFCQLWVYWCEAPSLTRRRFCLLRCTMCNIFKFDMFLTSKLCKPFIWICILRAFLENLQVS
jgi:hypothetical protein